MGKFTTGTSSHWYKRLSDGSIKPAYDANLRIARKESLFPSPTSIEKDIRANPVLTVWMKNQILKACAENPIQPHETLEDFTSRIVEQSGQIADDAADFGTLIHNFIEAYTRGADPVHPPEIEEWCDKFITWFNAYGLWIQYAELPVSLPHVGVAGKLDAIGTSNLVPDGRLTIFDWKTQGIKEGKSAAFYESWGRQLAFYAKAAQITLGLPYTPRCVSVVIDSQKASAPAFKIWSEEEIEKAFLEFLCQAWLWFSDREYWPVGRWNPGFTWSDAGLKAAGEAAMGTPATQHALKTQQAMAAPQSALINPFAIDKAKPELVKPTDHSNALKDKAFKQPATQQEEVIVIPCEVTEVQPEPAPPPKKKKPAKEKPTVVEPPDDYTQQMKMMALMKAWAEQNVSMQKNAAQAKVSNEVAKMLLNSKINW